MQVPYTEQVEQPYTVMVPTYEDRTVEYTVMVPYSEEATRTYTVMVPSYSEKTVPYQVQVPYTENVEQQYTVMVPSTEERQATRCVTRRVAQTTMRHVTVNTGHWETQMVQVPCGGGCAAGCGCDACGGGGCAACGCARADDVDGLPARVGRRLRNPRSALHDLSVRAGAGAVHLLGDGVSP